MKQIILYIFLIIGYARAQHTVQVEKQWLKLDVSNHTAVKSNQFYLLDSLLGKDSSSYKINILPEVFGSLNKFEKINNKFSFQSGVSFQLFGNLKSSISYDFDLRMGVSNTELFPYSSIFQTKSFGFESLNNIGTIPLSVYNDLRAKILYRPNKYLKFSGGIDKQFIGEGDRSLFLGNQGIASPFVSMLANYGNIEYHLIQQIWRERSGNKYDPKGNATHYLSYKPTKKWSIGIFESVVYQMKDTLYNRGFEVEYLNPLIFYRPQEYNMGSADNVLLGLNVSFTQKKTMFYGQLLLDDFLLSAIIARNKWWSNKFGLQVGIKSWKDLDSNRQLFYRTEFNLVRPYTYSQKNIGVVMGNQGLPIAHPLGSNFIEIYQEITLHTKKWNYEFWLQAYLKGIDWEHEKLISYGGNIYQPYNLHPKEFGNTIGQGQTTRVVQLGSHIERLLLKNKSFVCFIEPRILFYFIEEETQINHAFTFGISKLLGRDRRNY